MRLIDEAEYQCVLAKIPMDERTFRKAVEVAQDMPTVCDIEQIRAEIEKERQACIDAHDQYGAVAIGEVLKIFDKYKGGQNEVD